MHKGTKGVCEAIGFRRMLPGPQTAARIAKAARATKTTRAVNIIKAKVTKNRGLPLTYRMGTGRRVFESHFLSCPVLWCSVISGWFLLNNH